MPHAIIVGAGAYGASLACTLITKTSDWKVTVLDRAECAPSISIGATSSSASDATEQAQPPAQSPLAPDAASHDVNKIIRADYTDGLYRSLGKEAIALWRAGPVWAPFYHEVGVLFRSGPGSDAVCNGPLHPHAASTADMAYVQAGIRGAHEAEEPAASGSGVAEGTDDGAGAELSVSDAAASARARPLAFRLATPEQALSVFPPACRPRLGPGISSIGRPVGDVSVSAQGAASSSPPAPGAVPVQQDAYLNPRGGWADAAAATQATLIAAARAGGPERVRILGGASVCGVLTTPAPASASGSGSSGSSKPRVVGVRTASGAQVALSEAEAADGRSAVVLCAGSWTRDLLDELAAQLAADADADDGHGDGEKKDKENGKAHARAWPVTPSAQCVMTVQLPEDMAQRYRGCPVVLNFNTGFYVFEPNHEGILKAAIHSVGYQHPRPARSAAETIRPPAFAAGEAPRANGHGDAGANGHAQPRASGLDGLAEDYIPASKLDEMLSELGDMYPDVAVYARDALQSGDAGMAQRVRTRVCHYSDSADENWIIDHFPDADGLLVASGDSGHGFKFLPNIGRLIAARMGVRAKGIPPLTAHEARVFSFDHHFKLAALDDADIAKTDSNRYKPPAHMRRG